MTEELDEMMLQRGKYNMSSCVSYALLSFVMVLCVVFCVLRLSGISGIAITVVFSCIATLSLITALRRFKSARCNEVYMEWSREWRREYNERVNLKFAQRIAEMMSER